MKKSLILSSVMAGILLGNVGSKASPMIYGCNGEHNPGNGEETVGFTQDTGRTITGFISSIMGLFGGGEAIAQLIATLEENNKKACGDGGDVKTTNTSAGVLSGSAAGSEFPGSAFEYVNANLLSKGIGNISYSPLKKVLNSTNNTGTLRKDIRTAVLKNFFADPTKQKESTIEYQNKISDARSAYVQEASKRHVTLGYHIKGHIQNDFAAISSASLSGDGELGSVAVDAHTLEQMVKVALVDLAVQIEMMEADAINFLMQQPIELMSETKPTKKKKGGKK